MFSLLLNFVSLLVCVLSLLCSKQSTQTKTLTKLSSKENMPVWNVRSGYYQRRSTLVYKCMYMMGPWDNNGRLVTACATLKYPN